MWIERLTGQLRHLAVIHALAIVFASGCAQQKAPATPQSRLLSISPDRASASYEIYSQLLTSDEIEWGRAPRSFWLIEDTTSAQPPNEPCASAGSMNPHEVIEAPFLRRWSFAQVLADFDAHCHERYRLEASQFHLKSPVRLLNEEDRKHYVDQVSRYMPPRDKIMQAPPTPDQFKGAAGMHRFTAVYFNRAHTLAMTRMGMYCGNLCGEESWVVLERKNEHWQILPWVNVLTVSDLRCNPQCPGAKSHGAPKGGASQTPTPPAILADAQAPQTLF